MMLNSNPYNPDVLTCLANLSSDEVFTPPKLANEILDQLPEELWSNPDAKFLDPFCKSGVFLREIAKRLLAGLEAKIPDQQERINHIFKNQLYGIAITALTALLCRRSVYCSKTANGKYSVCDQFDDVAGNIRYERMEHTWVKGRCKHCGASQEGYERDNKSESHAYEFIHTNNPENIFNMKFDVIIGNPPYQLSDGGNNASATPIYNIFAEKAKAMSPNHLIMVIPARWYCGGRGLGSFRDAMLRDGHLRAITDYSDASDCFPGIRVGGGVCIFFWDKQYNSDEIEVTEIENGEVARVQTRKKLEGELDFFIRNSVACEIVRKVIASKFKSLEDYVLSQKPFGLRTNFDDFDKNGELKIYTKKVKTGHARIRKNRVTKNANLVSKWKLVTSRSTSVPEEDNGQVLRISQTFIAEPRSVVTESYVVVGVFDTKKEAENCLSYLKTKFFRMLCQLTIVSPDVSPRTFSLVPHQDFSKPWQDEDLYKMYKLTRREISFIEEKIRAL